MYTSSRDDVHLEKWRKRSQIIAAFLNEYGEHANWEEWIAFLHEQQANGFEWSQSVD